MSQTKAELVNGLSLNTASADAVTVDSSGKVGIGMTPSSGTGYILQLESGQAQTFMSFGNTGTGNGALNGLVVGNDTSRAYFTQRENQPIHIATNNVDQVAIDSSGKVGIGTTSPDQKLTIGDGDLKFFNSDAANNHRTTFIEFQNSSNRITSESNFGSDGSSAYAAGYKFGTKNFNGSAFESLTPFCIQANGNCGIGTTSPGKPLTVDSGSSSSNHFVAEFTGVDSTNAASCNFYYMGCGSDDNRTGLYWEHQNVSNVRMWMDDSSNLRQSSSDPTANNSGTAFSYAGGSDYRLKENVVDYTNGITELKQLKPYKFNYIETDRIIVDKADVLCSGFYAHEAGAVVPASLIGKKDEVDFEGNPVYQALKYEKFVPLLTAALQEEIAKREALETRVAALEAA